MIAASIVTARQDVPAGKTPGLYRVTMSTPGAADVVQAFAGTSFEFPAVAAGTYTFVAVRLDTDGNPISAPVSASIDVPPVVVDQFDAPASIVLSLA